MKNKNKREIKGLTGIFLLLAGFAYTQEPLFIFIPEFINISIGGSIAVLSGIYIMELIMQKEIEEKEDLTKPDWEEIDKQNKEVNNE